MEKIEVDKYYRIRKPVIWTGVIAAVATILVQHSAIKRQTVDEKEPVIRETCRMEYGKLQSGLENADECYLCGSSDESLMDYYRKFDTIGIIGLNEWCVLDLHLKEYDDNGSYMESMQGGQSYFGNTQGVNYSVNSTPSRGMSNANISSEKGTFVPKTVQRNLCQECLDKVTDTLEAYQTEGERERYVPFVLVDFETLQLYSMQEQNTGYFIRDYWVDIEYGDEIELAAYYFPERKEENE